MSAEIEWLENETWQEHCARYPRPKALVVPPEHDLPDGIVKRDYCFDWDGERKMTGFILQLLTPKGFEAFPEALTEGPTKGLLWFPEEEIGNLCALEEALGLEFTGIV